MKRPYKVLIAGDIDLSSVDILPSTKYFITVDPSISTEKIISEYNHYDILIIRSTRKITGSFIERTRFKIIATCSKGFDHIDISAARKKKVKVLYSEKGNSVSAAEHTLALILAGMKNLLLSNTLVRSGKFIEYGYERYELEGKTIGVIGFGNVGSKVAQLSKVFGMKIIAYDIDKSISQKFTKIEFASLSNLLKQSDIITIHIPLNAQNKHFISEKKISIMKKGVFLINTSRGGVIEEKFLIKALKSQLIRFGAFDVFENEPKIDKRFFSLPNVILTNHIAGKTYESRIKMAKEIFNKIRYFS